MTIILPRYSAMALRREKESFGPFTMLVDAVLFTKEKI